MGKTVSGMGLLSVLETGTATILAFYNWSRQRRACYPVKRPVRTQQRGQRRDREVIQHMGRQPATTQYHWRICPSTPFTSQRINQPHYQKTLLQANQKQSYTLGSEQSERINHTAALPAPRICQGCPLRTLVDRSSRQHQFNFCFADCTARGKHTSQLSDNKGDHSEDCDDLQPVFTLWRSNCHYDVSARPRGRRKACLGRVALQRAELLIRPRHSEQVLLVVRMGSRLQQVLVLLQLRELDSWESWAVDQFRESLEVKAPPQAKYWIFVQTARTIWISRLLLYTSLSGTPTPLRIAPEAERSPLREVNLPPPTQRAVASLTFALMDVYDITHIFSLNDPCIMQLI